VPLFMRVSSIHVGPAVWSSTVKLISKNAARIGSDAKAKADNQDIQHFRLHQKRQAWSSQTFYWSRFSHAMTANPESLPWFAFSALKYRPREHSETNWEDSVHWYKQCKKNAFLTTELDRHRDRHRIPCVAQRKNATKRKESRKRVDRIANENELRSISCLWEWRFLEASIEGKSNILGRERPGHTLDEKWGPAGINGRLTVGPNSRWGYFLGYREWNARFLCKLS
jgi:hypothetical protein